MGSEELRALAPLATLNFARRAATSAAVERGDLQRTALRSLRGYLDGQQLLQAESLHSFLSHVFESYELTPPMMAHVQLVHRLFGMKNMEPLEALWLCDALVRAMLYQPISPRIEACRCGAAFEEDSLFCTSCGAKRLTSKPLDVPRVAAVSPKRLDQSRIRTCHPFAATSVPVTATLAPTAVPLARSRAS